MAGSPTVLSADAFKGCLAGLLSYLKQLTSFALAWLSGSPRSVWWVRSTMKAFASASRPCHSLRCLMPPLESSLILSRTLSHVTSLRCYKTWEEFHISQHQSIWSTGFSLEVGPDRTDLRRREASSSAPRWEGLGQMEVLSNRCKNKGHQAWWAVGGWGVKALKAQKAHFTLWPGTHPPHFRTAPGSTGPDIFLSKNTEVVVVFIPCMWKERRPTHIVRRFLPMAHALGSLLIFTDRLQKGLRTGSETYRQWLSYREKHRLFSRSIPHSQNLNSCSTCLNPPQSRPRDEVSSSGQLFHKRSQESLVWRWRSEARKEGGQYSRQVKFSATQNLSPHRSCCQGCKGLTDWEPHPAQESSRSSQEPVCRCRSERCGVWAGSYGICFRILALPGWSASPEGTVTYPTCGLGDLPPEVWDLGSHTTCQLSPDSPVFSTETPQLSPSLGPRLSRAALIEMSWGKQTNKQQPKKSGEPWMSF